MKSLAQDHWTKNIHTRIEWCRDTIYEYFIGGGLQKALEKDEKRRVRGPKLNQKTLSGFDMKDDVTRASERDYVQKSAQMEGANPTSMKQPTLCAVKLTAGGEKDGMGSDKNIHTHETDAPSSENLSTVRSLHSQAAEVDPQYTHV
jgi:hypothetical protein